MLNCNRVKTLAEISEEMDKMRRTINIMTHSYDLLKEENDRLNDENNRLKLDIATYKGDVVWQD